jgi:hypothetical protein
LTATAVTVGALGIWAGAFAACPRQELSPGAQSGANGAERRPSDAKYDDGDFYFKNGAHVEGDCDGYNSEPGGKTTIYEWSQSEINKWEQWLKAAGVKPEIYRTSKPKHCWARFDTDLLSGIGWEGRGVNSNLNDEVDILANGTRLNFKGLESLHYAQARGNFTSSINEKGLNSLFRKASEAQKERNASAVILVFPDKGEKSYIKAAHALAAPGVSVIEKGETDGSVLF